MPSWAKFLVIILSTIMLTLGASNYKTLTSTFLEPDQNVVEPTSEKKIEVKFLIYSKEGNEPLERASVQFIFDGAPAPRLTNSDGYVRIEILDRNDVDVVIKKDGFIDINRTINLSVDQNRTVTYYLEKDANSSSYDLRNKSFIEGSKVTGESIENFSMYIESGNINKASIQNPYMTLDTQHLHNKKTNYEFLDSENNWPSKIIERILVDKEAVATQIDFTVEQDQKLYNYVGSLSGDGHFADTNILNSRQDEVWTREILDSKATNEQRLALQEKWDYNNIFHNYPRKKLKLGQSWDASNGNLLGELNNILILESTIFATLEDITEYEGLNVAKISISGRLKGISSSDENQDFSDEDSKDLSDKLLEQLLDSLLRDIVADYRLPELIQVIAENLYYGEFSIEDDLKVKSPKYYNALIKIYNKVRAEDGFYDYDLEKIVQSVTFVAQQEKLYELLLDYLAQGSDQKDTLDLSSRGELYDLTVNGEVYRALEYPLDVYGSLEMNGSIDSDDFKGTFTGSITQTYSIS